eukprot:g6539.t1
MVKLLLNKQKCFYPLALLWFLQIDLEQNELTTKCKPPFSLLLSILLFASMAESGDSWTFSTSQAPPSFQTRPLSPDISDFELYVYAMCHCACSIPGRMSATFFPMEDVRCNSAKCTDDTCRLTDSICADENARVEATGCFVDRDTDKDTNKDTDKDTDTEYDDTEDDKEKEYDVPEDDKQNSRMSQEAKALVDEEVAIMVHKSRVQDDAFLRYMVEMEQRVREKEAETAELRAQKSDTANVETSNSEQSVASAPTDKNNNDEDGNNTPYEDGDYAFRTQHDGTIEVIPASPPLPPPKPPGKPGKVADDGDEGEAQYPAHAVTEQDNGADWFEYYAKSVSGDSATWFTGAEEDTWFSGVLLPSSSLLFLSVGALATDCSLLLVSTFAVSLFCARSSAVSASFSRTRCSISTMYRKNASSCTRLLCTIIATSSSTKAFASCDMREFCLSSSGTSYSFSLSSSVSSYSVSVSLSVSLFVSLSVSLSTKQPVASTLAFSSAQMLSVNRQVSSVHFALLHLTSSMGKKVADILPGIEQAQWHMA